MLFVWCERMCVGASVHVSACVNVCVVSACVCCECECEYVRVSIQGGAVWL